MNLLFVYNNSNKIVKSPIELDLKLHEIRFRKKFKEIKIGEIITTPSQLELYP